MPYSSSHWRNHLWASALLIKKKRRNFSGVYSAQKSMYDSTLIYNIVFGRPFTDANKNKTFVAGIPSYQFNQITHGIAHWSSRKFVTMMTWDIPTLDDAPHIAVKVERGALIARSIFLQILIKQPHSSPGKIWGSFYKFKFWFTFCLSRCSDVCNIMLFWAVI